MERIYWLQTANLDSVVDSSGCNCVVYISSTDFRCASMVAENAKTLVGRGLDIHLVLAPEKSLCFPQALDENEVLGDVVIHTWPVYLLPLEKDVLSLNVPNGGFSDTYLDELTTAIHMSADAIQKLQNEYGLINRITGKGEEAAKLAEILLRKRDEQRTDLAENASSPKADHLQTFEYKYSNVFVGNAIDQLVIIDRQTDMLTPLLTQLTYQGLVDEFYTISDSGQVELPASLVDPPKKSANANGNTATLGSEMKKTSLGTNEKEDLFGLIRDTNFSLVGQTLNKVARQLQTDYEQRHEAKTVSQIKDFVGRLGGLQTIHHSLRFHTSLAEDLMGKVQGEEFNLWLEIQQNLLADTMDLSTIHSMIEDLIGRASSLTMVLRLLAIECLCNGGIKQKELQFVKREILQTYGYQHIITFNRLEKLGLVYPRSPHITNNYPSLRKQLSLITEQQENVEPTDIAFAYSGYAPLSVRLVQCVVDKQSVLKSRRYQSSGQSVAYGSSYVGSGGWKGAEDTLKLIPGATVDEIQRSDSHVREGKLRNILTRNAPSADKSTTIVFYLGGITYAEIAALRYIASKPNLNTNLIIATSGIISGQKIINTVSA